MNDEQLLAGARERLGLGPDSPTRYYVDLTAAMRMSLTRRERDAWQRLDDQEFRGRG